MTLCRHICKQFLRRIPEKCVSHELIYCIILIISNVSTGMAFIGVVKGLSPKNRKILGKRENAIRKLVKSNSK
jgi:hypothetical protein